MRLKWDEEKIGVEDILSNYGDASQSRIPGDYWLHPFVEKYRVLPRSSYVYAPKFMF